MVADEHIAKAVDFEQVAVVTIEQKTTSNKGGVVRVLEQLSRVADVDQSLDNEIIALKRR